MDISTEILYNGFTRQVIGMEIGARLKSARTARGLTQEQVAEKIGVSRQSVSNWENARSYPDIVSVIKLSDLYSVSLDELLKEDADMIKHLDESTNTVKSRNRLFKLIEVGGYLLITALVIIGFWTLPDPTDIMAYVLLTFYLLLPTTILVSSLFVGLDYGWGKARWLMLLFYGTMFMLTTFGTMFLSSNLGDEMNFWDILEGFSFFAFLVGVGFSAVGMGIGTLVRFLVNKKKGGITENNNPLGRTGA